ncbi:MAG TPA: type I methionyl aminopeptidase [Succinivibrionaceae bacterium]|nr:type I methionyl aminopeptidase [Succinivibrionaceae bacterium]
MEISLKSPSEIEKMRVAGKLAAEVLEMIEPFVVPGVTTEELDDRMLSYIENEQHAISACLGYEGYPKATCISINEVVCHGIPGKQKLHAGDIVNIDVTVIKDKYYGDTSRMFIVGGHTSPRNAQLCQCSQEAMYAAIKTVRPGSNLADIGAAIQKVADKYHFSIVRDYCGHGVGSGFHEDPQVLHYKNNFNLLLEAGMTFTIEPMINAGTWKVKVNRKDGWTATTADHMPSAQYEHTLLVTPTGVEVLTLRKDEDFPRFINHE